MNEYIALDTETTGVDPGSRLVELAGIRFNDAGEILDRFHTLVDPGMPIPEDVQKIHHITQEMVAGAPNAGIAIIDFFIWAQAADFVPARSFSPLVAHYAAFDCGVLAWEAARFGIGIDVEAPVFDTWRMARAYGGTKDNELRTLVDHFGIKVEGEAHRAMADAEACMRVFLALRSRIEPLTFAWSQTGYDYTYPLSIPEPLAGLPDWVDKGARVRMGYTDAQGKTTDRTVIPYGFAQRGAEAYFHGLCLLRGERREFRADRIQSIEVL